MPVPERPGLTADVVQRWMKDRGRPRDWAAAAAHFGRDESELRTLCRPRKGKRRDQEERHEEPTPKPSPPSSGHPADLDTLEFHRMLLVTALADIDSVPPRDRAALLNRAKEERAIIDAIVKEREAAGRQRMTLGQQVELMTEQYRRMPDALLKPAFDEYTSRHKLRILGVMAGRSAKDED